MNSCMFADRAVCIDRCVIGICERLCDLEVKRNGHCQFEVDRHLGIRGVYVRICGYTTDSICR